MAICAADNGHCITKLLNVVQGKERQSNRGKERKWKVVQRYRKKDPDGRTVARAYSLPGVVTPEAVDEFSNETDLHLESIRCPLWDASRIIQI